MTEGTLTVLIIALALVACVALVTLAALRLARGWLDLDALSSTRREERNSTFTSAIVEVLRSLSLSYSSDDAGAPDATERTTADVADDLRAGFNSGAGARAGYDVVPGYGTATSSSVRCEPDAADRVILPMSSSGKILPQTSAQIAARPQDVAFRPERIVIGGSPGDWIVNDIKVGNRSQLSKIGDLPGEMFSSTVADGFISFGTVQTAMDFVIQVTYVGDTKDGALFSCVAIGTAVV